MIREIYHGDFRPVDNAGMSDDYQEKRQVAHMLSIQFAKKINTEIKEDFEKVLEAYMEVLVAGMEESYISGFKGGIRLIKEVY